ncbi:PREDICTED: inactive leucine-rich repeat receptor-like serine/threonine-protein kinase At1g60630 [Tarenaya hassleriana]|uniref:inactive leucine-rich repeat receptor-like serine/threonine-protein kinase At1g60630 n=1 Tax=Tarenaya hassleriana TaxID=28532 RepID=UPI00053C7B7E|nr:PREDICTED: inactive leucine-rich repeat receptor-like serine/threonine-protein kinase At1g60630 [Tarenaya hassleriana]XP_010533928.1 PREDICTED: inactive leucine-rich repeat receptor-like serine/threonine-protein kinase At1g60630 [Tarenaya hassleriana]XP_010533929.1 PREDICTED: inactive leucine-rich repeat receptor-like serine/threonine-protein kinase At1g60630 [Tarenaya hassleriana]
MESVMGRYYYSSCSSSSLFLLLVASSTVFCLVSPARSGDVEALLSLKSSIDPFDSIPWRGTDLCNWRGVRECMNGRISKLVLEHLNLTGSLDGKSLNQLDQLRVLSFKGNFLSGSIPDLSGLVNLKSIYFNGNNFSGEFPESLTNLHRLKTIVLAGNRFSGRIPSSLLRLSRLYTLYLEANLFTGSVPPLNQTSLRFLNVSNNRLSGQIPPTKALKQFNTSSFSGNLGLCGDQIQNPCGEGDNNGGIAPTPSRNHPKPLPTKGNKAKRIGIIAGCVGGGVLILLLILLLIFRRRRKIKPRSVERKGKAVAAAEGATPETEGSDQKNRGFSWERGEEGSVGTLVFLGTGDPEETVVRYSMEDLLKASAETLGRGTVGSTYKAVMESGFIVTVKRLKDSRYPRMEEFKRHVEILGRLRHPNLVPLRAYFQAKEERLLVYDYFPNGSLFSLIHGTRGSGGGKPLHWTSCLKIAEDLAAGLLYIHQNPGLTHGNLKSSNVLLGPDFESCLTDYGLTMLHNPDSVEETSAASLFYRAPESRDPRKASTQLADVYSFGVLLLELLTGRTPYQDLVQEHGSDISHWVRAVREEETESGEEPTSSGNEASSEEKLQALLSIATACVALQPETRPVMREVLKMVRDARAEAPFSSNSSDHSPGRWSDTVQSLPREDHVSI